MAYTLIIAGLCIIFVFVLYILNYYGDRKSSPWYVILSIIIGWFLSFSIILVLPLDITSSIYRGLSDEEKLKTDPPIGYQSEEFFTIFWNIVYWISYVLTWLALPLLSGYILSGHFTPLKKFKDSIYQNILFYGVLGGIGVVFVIYIAIARQMTGKALLAFLMAMSNAWGLLLCIVFLGYGLVDIPRRYWRKSDLTWIQSYYQFKAPKLKDESLNAREELQKVIRDIFNISNSNAITSQNPLRKYLEKLIELCPISNEDADNSMEDDGRNIIINEFTITLDDLATLNYRLKNAILANTRCEEQYKELINKALRVEDILKFQDNPNRVVELPFIASNPDSWISKIKYKIAWLWYFKIRPYIYLSISIILAILSISIIWSEVTFQLYNSNTSLFYIYLKLSKYVSYIFFEFIIVILLIYMCLCTYTSLFKLQLFQYYRLFPHHHTDNNSLVFCAAYLCRLIFPLCYNFLNLTDNSQTAFSKIMGKIDLVPLLGKEFNGYVPIMMAVFTLITFFNIHGKILKYFGIDSHFGIDHFSITNENDQDEIQDGKYLIEQARREQERNHSLNLNSKYDSINYSDFNLRNAIRSSSNMASNKNNGNKKNKNSSNHHPNSNRYRQESTDSVNTNTNNYKNGSNSPAFDYPFHFKSQNKNYPYAAPSSTEYNQRFGSSSNGSTCYTPSVGGHSSNATINIQNFNHNTNGLTSKNAASSSNRQSSIFSGIHTPFHISSSKKNKQNKPKKKFGFNININPDAFYNNYPPSESNNNKNMNSNNHSNGYHAYSSGSYPTSSHSNSIGTSPLSANNATSSSSRKFGYNPNGGVGNIGGPHHTPNFSTSTNNQKSKTRMFGINYKLNG